MCDDLGGSTKREIYTLIHIHVHTHFHVSLGLGLVGLIMGLIEELGLTGMV